MLLILFVLVLAILIWITFRPGGRGRQPANQFTSTISRNAARAAAATKTATGTTGKWFKRLKTQSALGQQLKVWASDAHLGQETALDLPEEIAGLRDWLSRLSDDQADHWANELAAFCHSQNLKLAWLFDDKTDAELKAALSKMVIGHALAVWKGQSSQSLVTFQVWEAAPNKKENRVLTQQLYTRLVAAGLISTPGDLLLASDKERTTYAVRAIQAVAAENRPAVLAALAELNSEESVSQSGQVKSQPKPPTPVPPVEAPIMTEQAVAA